MEILVAVLGAIGGLFIFQQLVKANNGKKQAELESAVKKIEAKASDLTNANSAKEKETQDKVDAITKEQEKPTTTAALVDWFNNRK